MIDNKITEDIKYVQPSPKDDNDFTLGMFNNPNVPLPTEYDKYSPTPMNQLNSSMCGAFACAYMKEIQEFIERGVRIKFSPAYLYGIRDGWAVTEGVYLRNVLKDLSRYGMVRFDEFPVIDSIEQIREALLPRLHELAPFAIGNAIKSYYKINNREDFDRAIYNDGAVLINFKVYESFMRPTNGVVGYTKSNEKFYGYHIVCLHGWKLINGKKYYIGTNSWGDKWGDKGRFYIPFDYPEIVETYGATDSPLLLNDKTKLIMYVGNKELRTIVNDTTVFTTEMDVPPTVLNGRTLVPLSLIAQALGAKVEWIAEHKCIIISADTRSEFKKE